MDKPRRAMCAQCERPAATCICSLVTQVQGEADLLILQHPMEAGHDKGSARLLQLCVRGSSLVRGEQFDPAVLASLLAEDGRTPVLLFPETGDATPPLPPLEARQLRLVVLDGTWRKCRKMLYLNPGLADLPRLSLVAPPPTRYRIRTAPGADQLSTLEAACHALAALERAEARYQPVIAAFSQFVSSHPALPYRAAAACSER